MRHTPRTKVSSIVLLGVLLAALFPTTAFAGPSAADQIVNLLNAERAAHGLGALQVHPDLVAGAEMQADVIVANGALSHNQNLGALTEGWNMLGENVAMGYQSAQAMHDGWMDSDGHRDNILKPNYDFVGVAVVSTDNGLVGAQVFMDAAYDGRFMDDDNSVHQDNIDWLATSGITMGCTSTRFCPTDTVTRGQMAAFIQRALGLSNGSGDTYRDDNNSIFEGAIQALANAGIAEPCAADRYCPDAPMTREMMAVFLERALNLPASNNDRFTDDDNSAFESEIQAIAAAGITVGCSETRYCPDSSVTREQMASFLRRAFG